MMSRIDDPIPRMADRKRRRRMNLFRKAARRSRVLDAETCKRCGYMLRGLNTEQRCPECGLQICVTIEGEPRHYGQPGGLPVVCGGVVIVALCLLLYCPMVVLSLWIADIQRLMPIALPAVITVCVVGVLLATVPCWEITELKPARQLACWSALAAIGLTALVALINPPLPTLGASSSELVYRLIVPFVPWALALYVAKLTAEMSDAAGLRRTLRLSAAGLLACQLVVAGLWVLSISCGLTFTLADISMPAGVNFGALLLAIIICSPVLAIPLQLACGIVLAIALCDAAARLQQSRTRP